MLRFFWGAFALACGVTQAFSAPPTPPDDSVSAPMRFEWRREGPAEACGANTGVDRARAYADRANAGVDRARAEAGAASSGAD